MSNKTKFTLLIIFTAIVVIVAVVPRYMQDEKSIIAAPIPKTLAGTDLPVDVFVITPQSISNKIFTTGTLLASEETALFSESAGKVTGIFFEEGEMVKKGTLLIKLNDRDLVAQADRIKIEKGFAEKTLARQKQLFEKGGISREQFDQAQNRVAVFQAQLEEIIARIEKTEVRAPYDGIIGLRQISNGAYLTSTIQAASIQNIDQLKLEFAIPEKYFRNVHVNDNIKFRISGVDSMFTAIVYAIEPQIDVNTRTVIMRARFNNTNAQLFPGLFAYIEYSLEEIEEAIMIPTQAVVPELKGQKVFLLKNNLVDEVSIETALRTDTEIQVTSGLSVGDTVITTGILQIRKGIPVSVRNVN